MDASQTSISIDTIQSSIEGVIKNWQRRQRWQFLLHSQQQEEHVSSLKIAPWRTHLANFLESMPVRLLTIALLLLDLVFTVLDLSKSLLSRTSATDNRKGNELLYHWGGIAILSLLLAKLVVLAVALGGLFFRRPGLVVDGLVVIGALAMELLVEAKGTGLLVVASLWRVVRVVESVFELSDEAIEAQIEGILLQFEALQDENRRLLETIAEKNERIAELERALGQYLHAYFA